MSEPESFNDLLSQFEQAHAHKPAEGRKQLEGTVIAVTGDSVLLDIGFKTEGILPLAAFQDAAETVKPGDKFPVSVTGRDPEGYYQLSRTRVERPTDWSSLQQAFTEQAAIMGTVTAVCQGRGQRGCRRARLHARLAQRHPRRRRAGKTGGPGDPLPHHQARHHRRRCGGRPPRRPAG